MAFDEKLAKRVRGALGELSGLEERTMFGGLAFLLGGHMCCGVLGKQLMVRVGADAYAEALALPHAHEMDFTGRPLRGMVYVDPAGTAAGAALAAWVRRGVRHVQSLPPK